jgi:methyl-accepting chemotaxis protein
MSAAIQPTLVQFADAPATAELSGNSSLSDIGERSGLLGVEIADMAGVIGDLAKLGQQQADSARGAIAATRQMMETNGALTSAMGSARTSAHAAQTTLRESAAAISGTISATIEKLEALGSGAISVKTSLEEVSETVARVHETSDAIQQIAYETQLLALNAGIEAAHAGDAGKGFAIIANAVNELAQQVRKATKQNQEHLEQLERTLADLFGKAQENAATAQQAQAESADAQQVIGTFHGIVENVQTLAASIDSMSQSAERNNESYETFRSELRGLVGAVKSGTGLLTQAQARAESILGISEDFILFIAESGIETPDTPIIDLAKRTASEVAELFERAVTRGEISMADLFDEKYQPVANSDPPQHMTRFVTFTDRRLPPIQEAILSADPRITFCAAIDRNGFLPTHNKIYSQPQGPDPVWNAANCRNRRIFNDRTGLSAGRSTRPFLLQTYRRDMGGGTFVLMKDASAPISVRGRHWGGFRIGFKV